MGRGVRGGQREEGVVGGQRRGALFGDRNASCTWTVMVNAQLRAFVKTNRTARHEESIVPPVNLRIKVLHVLPTPPRGPSSNLPRSWGPVTSPPLITSGLAP